jgi:hypothetical protein
MMGKIRHRMPCALVDLGGGSARPQLQYEHYSGGDATTSDDADMPATTRLTRH